MPQLRAAAAGVSTTLNYFSANTVILSACSSGGCTATFPIACSLMAHQIVAKAAEPFLRRLVIVRSASSAQPPAMPTAIQDDVGLMMLDFAPPSHLPPAIPISSLEPHAPAPK